MTRPGHKPVALIDPSISWLMGIAVACLAVVLGVKVFFDNLQEQLREQSANERARLFVGEEVVRGIHGIEKDLYMMAAATNLPTVRRISGNIDRQLVKLHHDLSVLKEGGTVRREVLLNLEGWDEMVREATYRPKVSEDAYVMELIEIGPLLDQIQGKANELEKLLVHSWEYQESGDERGFYRFHDQLDAFLKHIPPYFARLDENANRLFFDSSEHLREIEASLAKQRQRLKYVEMGAMALVMVLGGLLGMFFLRRINVANQQLELALGEMRAAKDAAERASRAKSEFVSRMSHELRTPLNAIIGFAELLADEPLSPSHKGYVNLINDSGRHLMELINAVLDHAKIEAGGLTLESIAYDLPANIEAVRTMVAERANEKGLSFIADVDPQLPRYVIGDPTRLRQVLINVLNNAVKFTEQGSVELRVTAYESRIVFSVRDSGIGMDEVALGRLFKPFSQADDSVTRKFGGTGLGLMISKELVEAMGGSIEVESSPGVGTVFWLSLPLKASHAPEEAVPVRRAEESDIASLVGGRVLLVDDNRVNQQLASAMLERLGLAYECADNGRDALCRLAGTDFSLVLMDMEMPEMDGVMATCELRAREVTEGRPPLPVIAMTANALQEDRERCMAAGMNGFVSKPVSLHALQDEIRRLFGSETGVPAADPAQMALETTAAGPEFDRAAALAAIGDDEELFDQLTGMFVADAPGYLAEMQAALAAADAERLARVAHTLKGLCATFGAQAGESAGRQLEQAARDNRNPDWPALAETLRVRIESLVALMQKP